MSQSWLSAILSLLSVATAVIPAGAQQASEQRPQIDLTGVWTLYRAPGSSFAGFSLERPKLPFTAEGERRRDEYEKLLGPEAANPGAYCVDYGMPSMMEQAGGYPIEFIQKPDQLTIIYEVEGETRRVYLGDRRVPKEKRIPSRQGYSQGHWEGEVLVVETTDLSDGVDQLQHPHSDQARIVERFSMETDAGGTSVISYEMTLTDSVYYTQPISLTKKWQRLDGYIIPYRCPDEFWLALLDLRRQQLHAGQPVRARMSDVYKIREDKE